MSKQYFENNDNLKSDPIYFEFYFKKNIINFKSDNGVFSKRGVDFGTSLLLQNVIINNQKTVLDVGCGIGIIGLTIAKSNPNIIVDMVDVNLRAIELAKENANNNNCLNVSIYESDIYQNINKKFDLILTNPPIRAGKKIVHKILLESAKYLNENGQIYCVIQKKQGADSAIKALKEVYKNVSVIDNKQGYLIIKSTNI